MNDYQYKIVFAGMVMDATKPSTVRAEMAKLMRVDPAQLLHLFTGEDVILKKGLSETDAKNYLMALRNIGAIAQMIPMDTGGLDFEQSAQPVKIIQKQVFDQQDESFSKSAIEHLSLQREAPHQKTVVTPLGGERKMPELTQPKNRPVVAAAPDEFCDTPWWSFEERLGIVRYFALFAAPAVAMLILFGLRLALPSGLWVILAFIVTVTIALFATSFVARRFHDLNITGHIAWLVTFSIAAAFFSDYAEYCALFALFSILILGLIPGQYSNNQYGAPCPPNNVISQSAAILGFLMIMISIVYVSTSDWQKIPMNFKQITDGVEALQTHPPKSTTIE